MSEVGTTSPVAKAKPTPLTGDERFVVLKTTGNPTGSPFEPGQVISCRQLSSTGDAHPLEEMQRLTRNGAMRLAADHEKEHDFVDLKKTLAPGKSLTEQNIELVNKVAKFESRCEELSASYEALKLQKSETYDPNKDQAVMEMQKADREMIAQLQGKLAKAEGTITSLNQKLQQKK